MRNEQFSTASQIKRNFNTSDSKGRAGVPIYYENGKMYYDFGEGHIKLVGKSGTGKTQCFVLPMISNIIKAKDSFIAPDPKGELYRTTAEKAKKNGYNLVVLNFRELYKSQRRWDPLCLIKDAYFSDRIDGKDIASMYCDDFATALQISKSDDEFWPNSSAETLQGIIYALLECAKPEEINIKSVCDIVTSMNERLGASILIKHLSDNLNNDSRAKKYLQTYINAPNDTRNSIYAVLSNSIKKFSQSEGLVNLLCNDNIHISSLDIDKKPLAVYVILPDETSTYDSLFTLFTNQIMSHFIRLADTKYNGKLPHRLWLICEELGAISSAIPDLDKWLTGARSRNIRIMLVLQSDTSQLEDVYGKSKAETINSTIGITIGFSTNSWSTNEEWSKRCGTMNVYEHGAFREEAVISPTQLAAMPKGTALVQIDGKYRYVAKFPMFYQTHKTSVFEPSDDLLAPLPISSFNLADYVSYTKERKRIELFGGSKPAFDVDKRLQELNLDMESIDD